MEKSKLEELVTRAFIVGCAYGADGFEQDSLKDFFEGTAKTPKWKPSGIMLTLMKSSYDFGKEGKTWEDMEKVLADAGEKIEKKLKAST